MSKTRTMLRILVLSICIVQKAIAFQAQSRVPSSSSHRLPRPLRAFEEYDFATYQSLVEDGGNQVATTSGDATLLIAVVVATVAAVGLAVLQLPNILQEGETKASSTKRAVAEPPKAQIPVKEKAAPIPEPVAEKTKKEEAIEAPKTARPSTDTTAKPSVPKMYFSGDDLTRVEQSAVQAFDTSNREGLVASLKRVLGLVRTARTELKEEQALRQTAEAELKAVCEEVRELEDSLELGQNRWTKTTLELGYTKDKLAASEKELHSTKEDLGKLQEEQQSLRKMGRAAWKLSRQRVGKRFRRNGGKKED